MPNNIGFFTAVKYELEVKSFNQSLLEKVDNYFYLGGKKAHVIQGKTKSGQEKILLAETNSSLLARIGKVVSYLTIILPLVFLIAKTILRATHTFRLIDPKKKLEKGINITEAIISKIHSLKSKILSGKNEDEIEWLSTGNNFVFKLKENPQIVFKTPRRMSTNQRFQNMIKAKEVCLLNRLGLLVIPQAKEFFVDGHSFIAEKSLDFNPKEGAQENLYQLYSSELSEAVHQLAIFIAKTGFNDVTWRNIPVLNEAPEYLGPRRIGLIDIEHFESRVNGFTGDANGSSGLLGCVSKEQIDTLVAEARKQNVRLSDQDIQNIKNQRLHDFQFDQGLNQFYQKHGIKIGNEPIQVDENSLDFSDYPKAEKLKALAIDLIKEINNETAESSPEDSIKGRRYVYINPNPAGTPFYGMNRALVDKNKKSSSYATDEEYENATYLGCVVKKLIDLGLIYKIVKRNGHGYFLQA
jgi:hypothetical protein